jgi:hypothetical protein
MAFAEPMTKVPGWDAAMQRELARMAATRNSGVHVEAVCWRHDTRSTSPQLRALPGFTIADADELPAGFVSGFRVRMPLVDMPRHMRYLADRFERSGGVIVRRRIACADRCQW